MKILLIEDNKDFAFTLQEELQKYFNVDLAFSGTEGKEKLDTNTYDLVILDYILPDIDGLQICKIIRNKHLTTPIFMLTGQHQIQKKVEALDLGADDYMTKPFNTQELLARIRALLRRSHQLSSSSVLSIADLTIDIANRIVKRGQKVIPLRRKEFNLLEYLARNAGRVITRDMILDHVWNSVDEPISSAINVHIKYLRDQIDRPFDKKLIKTVYGIGYKLEE